MNGRHVGGEQQTRIVVECIHITHTCTLPTSIDTDWLLATMHIPPPPLLYTLTLTCFRLVVVLETLRLICNCRYLTDINWSTTDAAFAGQSQRQTAAQTCSYSIPLLVLIGHHYVSHIRWVIFLQPLRRLCSCTDPRQKAGHRHFGSDFNGRAQSDLCPTVSW